MKKETHRIIERLSDDATWDDLQYALYVRQAVEAGQKAAREGRVVSADEARYQLGIRLG
jgi:hypothetical protein